MNDASNRAGAPEEQLRMQDEHIPTMTFGDALDVLRSGRDVRRQCWPLEAKQRLHFNKNNIFLKFHNNEHHYTFSLSGEDVLADDWLEFVDS